MNFQDNVISKILQLLNLIFLTFIFISKLISIVSKYVTIYSIEAIKKLHLLSTFYKSSLPLYIVFTFKIIKLLSKITYYISIYVGLKLKVLNYIYSFLLYSINSKKHSSSF